MKDYIIKIHEGDVALMGPNAPEKPTNIDGLLAYLGAISNRFGDTCVDYSVKWGASAIGKTRQDLKGVPEISPQVKELIAEFGDRIKDLPHSMAATDDEVIMARLICEIETLTYGIESRPSPLVRAKIAANKKAEIKQRINELGHWLCVDLEIDFVRKRKKDKDGLLTVQQAENARFIQHIADRIHHYRDKVVQTSV